MTPDKNQNKKERLERKANQWGKRFEWFHNNRSKLIIYPFMTWYALVGPFLAVTDPKKPEIVQKAENYKSKIEIFRDKRSDLKEKIREDSTYIATPEEIKDSLYEEKYNNYEQNLEKKLSLYNKNIDYYKNQVQDISSSKEYQSEKRKYEKTRDEALKKYLSNPTKGLLGYLGAYFLFNLGSIGMGSYYQNKLKKYNDHD